MDKVIIGTIVTVALVIIAGCVISGNYFAAAAAVNGLGAMILPFLPRD